MPARLSRSPVLALSLLFITLPLVAQDAPTRPDPPADAIPIHSSFVIESATLSEARTINIYTPLGYERSPGVSYPVLYMLDGGLAEDFPHVVNTIDSLITLGEIRPVIVVGIENTERRRDLTGPTTVASDSGIAPRVGGSAPFRRFIRDELIPAIRGRYRTCDETTIVGESLAGLFIVETFLLEPALFQRYIVLSPSIWWDNQALIRSREERIAALTGLTRTIYLSAANESQIAEGTAALATTLTASHLPGLTIYYQPRPDLTHDTIFRAVSPGVFARLLK